MIDYKIRFLYLDIIYDKFILVDMISIYIIFFIDINNNVILYQ